MQRRFILTSTLAALAILATPSAMSGCSSTQIRDLVNAPTAMDLLSPLVKDAANGYIANLAQLNTMLAEVDSIQGVIALIEQIQPAIDQLSSAYQTLADTTPEEREWLWEAFGPQLSQVNEQFLSMSESIADNSSWSGLLTPVLDRVELFL